MENITVVGGGGGWLGDQKSELKSSWPQSGWMLKGQNCTSGGLCGRAWSSLSIDAVGFSLLHIKPVFNQKVTDCSWLQLLFTIW